MNKIIVSFTTYPERINTIKRILDCLEKQTILPDKIILYLSEGQFEGRILPKDLQEYEKYGFEVCWKKEDLGSHKKYFYVMQDYPDDIIITIDDDFYYKETLIEELMEGYKKFPGAVIARRAAVVTCLQNGEVAPYIDWCENYMIPESYINTPRMDVFATTGGGTLFQPRLFKREIYNKDIIMNYCRYADDIWIKVMQLINNVPTVVVNNCFDDVLMEEYRGTGLFVEYNERGGNDSQFSDLLNIYNGYYGESDKLTNRLFGEGRLYVSKMEEIYEEIAIKEIDSFRRFIADHEQIVIYGAGVVGKRIFQALKKAAIYEKVEAFVVSDLKNNPKKYMGYLVKNYRDYIDKTKAGIIVGLLPEKQTGVINKLIQEGISEERIMGVNRKANRVLIQYVKQ